MVTKEFILAGRAVFTVEIPVPVQEAAKCHPHYTYRVKHKPANGQYPETWFVALLTGPDNTSSYTYMGKLLPSGEVRLTAKSQYSETAFPLVLLRRVLSRLWAGEGDVIEQGGFQVHHEGKCGRCGRVLTVPESITSGFGPECIKYMSPPSQTNT